MTWTPQSIIRQGRVIDGLDPENIPDDSDTAYYRFSASLGTMLTLSIRSLLGKEIELVSKVTGSHKVNKTLLTYAATYFFVGQVCNAILIFLAVTHRVQARVIVLPCANLVVSKCPRLLVVRLRSSFLSVLSE